MLWRSVCEIPHCPNLLVSHLNPCPLILIDNLAGSTPYRSVRYFSEEAATICRSGNAALKGNLHEHASTHFMQALSSSPFLWEAFEGLCTLGMLLAAFPYLVDGQVLLGTAPPVDSLFPRRPLPSKKALPGDTKSPHGGGFFSPDNSSFTFSNRRHDISQTRPFRMEDGAGPNDSMSVTFYGRRQSP